MEMLDELKLEDEDAPMSMAVHLNVSLMRGMFAM